MAHSKVPTLNSECIPIAVVRWIGDAIASYELLSISNREHKKASFIAKASPEAFSFTINLHESPPGLATLCRVVIG